MTGSPAVSGMRRPRQPQGILFDRIILPEPGMPVKGAPANCLPDTVVWPVNGAPLQRCPCIRQRDRARHTRPLLDRALDHACDHAPVQHTQAVEGVIDLDQ